MGRGARSPGESGGDGRRGGSLGRVGVAEKVLRECEALPTLPAVAARLLAVSADEAADIAEIVGLIEADPTLTARLLKLCNASMNAARSEITTVRAAVVRLGLETVRSLALSVHVLRWGKSVAGIRGEGWGFDWTGFWQHSIGVACASEMLAREARGLGVRPEEAFVCGLVHDLGKLALGVVLPKAHARAATMAERRGLSVLEAEREVIGVDHQQAGAVLADRWGLPTVMQRVMAGHHAQPAAWERTRGKPGAGVIALVAGGNAICHGLGVGWSSSRSDPGLDEAWAMTLGVDPKRLGEMVPELFERASARCEQLGLGEEPSQRLMVDALLRANLRLGSLNEALARANVELRETQAKLAEAESMARLGEMTAGAAHELNNPLTVICGQAQRLSVRAPTMEDRVAAQTIVDAGRKLTTIITRLHRIGRPPRAVWEPVRVVEAIGEAVRRGKRRLMDEGKSEGLATVRIVPEDDLDAARLDRELFAEALSEIVVNALEASPRTEVEVRVLAEPIGSGRSSRLVIEVRDDGRGMSEHAVHHATDPFFSEKIAGRQPGLGLALAQRLFGAMEGRIEIHSTVGRGTAVRVSFERWRWEDRDGEASGATLAA